MYICYQRTNDGKFTGTSYETELQKTNQKEFRIKKGIK